MTEVRRETDDCEEVEHARLMANDRRIMDGSVAEELKEIIDHPENGTHAYLSTKKPFNDVDGSVASIVSMSIDITGRSEIDREFLHVARRTAMGDMAAAIAHEIDQPLAAIFRCFWPAA